MGPASLPALAYLILLTGIWSAGFPRAADSLGHLFKAEYLARLIASDGVPAYFTAAWLPEWYMGDAFRTFYPPLTTLLLTPVVALARDPALAHKLFTSAALLIFGGLTYAAAERIWGRWEAALAATMALLAPYQLRTLFFEGNYPRGLALLALPVLFWGTERVLKADTRLIPFVIALAGAWGWAILAHPQQAYMFAIGFALYVLLRLFLEADIEFRRGAYWLGGLVGGALLAAPWALPAYSHMEIANVPFLPAEKVDLFAAPLSAVIPLLERGTPQVQIGLAVLVLGLLAAVSRPEPRRMALAISALLTIWFAFGPPAVAFSLLPLSGQLLPERFLNFSVYALALGAGGLLPLRGSAVGARAVVIAGLLLVDLIPTYPLLQNGAYPQEEAVLFDELQGLEEGGFGRAALFAYPEPRAQEIYFAARAMPVINGWALENTPHHEGLRRYLDAPMWAPGYLESRLSRWGAEVVVLRDGGASQAAVVAGLVEAGYRLRSQGEGYQIFEAARPLSPVQVIPDSLPVVVGEKESPLLAAFPSAEEAIVDQLSALEGNLLEQHPLLVLYNFESSVQTLAGQSARLEAFLEGGGVIVTDLSGMEDDFGRTLDFFGIDVTKLAFNDPMEIDWQGPFEGLPQSLPLSEANATAWTGATYQGLDRVYATAEYGGNPLPILGFKDVGEGRIWVIGLNLLYYAQQAGLDPLVEAFREAVLEDVGQRSPTRFEMVRVSDWLAGPRGLSFTYDAEQDIPSALISYTYSPRFELTVDGDPAPTGNFEHLLTTSLPAGRHIVEIRYQPYRTLPPILGLLAALVGVAVLAAADRIERARFLPPMPGEPEPEVKTDREYAPCANCGFLLSEVGPPTGITYPFQVVHCPICGLSMDDDGFNPGEELEDGERSRRLAEWLAHHDYDPETVHQRWGFEPEQFFGEMEGASPPRLPGVDGEDVDGE